MASSIPNQDRAVDPFASYNSTTVNTLTRMLTYGEEGIATPLSCDVIDSTSSNTEVILEEGFVYMDDVWFNISSDHVIDFTDSEHYYNFDTGFDEAGYYYIVLDYTYVKSRPAPQAKALIVKPSQRNLYTEGGSWLFLKAVKVEGAGPFYVVSVHNFDPENTDNRRVFTKTYAGTEVGLPTHVPATDQGRIVYGIEEDDFFFGLSNRWESAFGSVSFPANTLGLNIGNLVYVDTTGDISLAIATASSRTADGVVSNVSATGVVKTSGKADNVEVESAANVNVGDVIYLSKSEAGKVTNQRTPQFVGKCIEVIDSNTVNILFHRGEPTSISVILSAGVSWILDGGSGLYYQEIDISDFGRNVAFEIFDTATRLIIMPSNIEFVSTSIARIWMPNNTIELNVTIIG